MQTLTCAQDYAIKPHAAVKPRQYFMGRFSAGLPGLKAKKSSKWRMRPDASASTQASEAPKMWVLEDDTKTRVFKGIKEAGQQATYCLFIMQGENFVAIPAGDWYNFRTETNFKVLTLEEAEERMAALGRAAAGYQRLWMSRSQSSSLPPGAELIKQEGQGDGGSDKEE
eukprot:jgi/Chlat1/4381/Chrsp29S04613